MEKRGLHSVLYYFILNAPLLFCVKGESTWADFSPTLRIYSASVEILHFFFSSFRVFLFYLFFMNTVLAS